MFWRVKVLNFLIMALWPVQARSRLIKGLGRWLCVVSLLNLPMGLGLSRAQDLNELAGGDPEVSPTAATAKTLETPETPEASPSGEPKTAAEDQELLAEAGQPAEELLLDGEKVVTWIGFQQFQEASRVFVRTNEAVKYRLERTHKQLLLLVLENARIPLSNNLNHLDTHWFSGPVDFIEPKFIEGPSAAVEIAIHLKYPASYNLAQQGNIVAVDFLRD